MKKIHFPRKALWFLLLLSITINVFTYRSYLDEKSNVDLLNIFGTVETASSHHKVDYLSDIAVDRPDQYWEDRFIEIRENSTPRCSLGQQLTVTYDNGKVLIIEIVENFEYDYMVKDLYFLDNISPES